MYFGLNKKIRFANYVTLMFLSPKLIGNWQKRMQDLKRLGRKGNPLGIMLVIRQTRMVKLFKEKKENESGNKIMTILNDDYFPLKQCCLFVCFYIF